MSRRSALIVTQSDNKRPIECPFPGGRVAIYSNQSPHKHTGNEDSAAVLTLDDESGILVVADGVGGLPAGGQASELTVKELAAEIRKKQDIPVRSLILNAIEQANEKLLALRTGTATTVCVLEVNGNIIRPYHVGDSACIVAGQRGLIKLQTMPHSPTGYGLAAGLIDEQEALSHDERHLISNMVGASDMRIEIGTEFKLSPRDTVVMASDGLFDNLLTDEIVKIIRKGPLLKAAIRLAAVVRNRMRHREGHADDLTFILYRQKSDLA